MKARLLKKLLNNTDYTVGNHEEYIAVGGAVVHDLISVNKKTLKIKYTLDTFHKGQDVINVPMLAACNGWHKTLIL